MPDAAQPAGEKEGSSQLRLSKAHRMLLDIRDALYDGSWDDFARDLEARRKSKPHVFDTVPDSPEMKETIETHLALINEMRTWEQRTGQSLRSDSNNATNED